MIEILRLVLDTALLVLIWMVQLIIYPSFLYYQPQDLVKWHRRYTMGITTIVLPLMLGQLLVSLYQLLQVQNSYTITSCSFVLLLWLATFSIFVPRHNAISKGITSKNLLHNLVHYNWLRTFLWTFLFCYTLMTML